MGGLERVSPEGAVEVGRRFSAFLSPLSQTEDAPELLLPVLGSEGIDIVGGGPAVRTAELLWDGLPVGDLRDRVPLLGKLLEDGLVVFLWG